MKRILLFLFAMIVSAFCAECGTCFAADRFDLAASSAQSPGLPSLESLERLVTNGPEVLASLSAVARDGYLLELQAERMTPKAFAALTYGYNDEPISETAEERYTYGKLAGTVGVSFPLLGTWTRQKIDRIHAEVAQSESRYRADLLKLQNLTALRKAYALLWVEERRLPILQAFLSDEAKVMELLTARSKKNLLLEADLFEFGTMFAAARRDVVASRVNVSRSLSTIALATGQRWSLPAQVAQPTLPGLGDLVFNLQHHPEILAMNEASRLYAEIARISGKPDREANLDIGLIGTYDFPGTYGTGAYVGVAIKEPFGTLKAGSDKAKLAASADADRARWELALAEARLQGNFDEQLLWGDYARETLRFGTARLVAAQESVRERTLRHGKIAGDTLEQLVKSRYACLRVAMDVLDAESLSLQTYIELVSMLNPDADQGGGERVFPLEDTPRREGLLAFSPLFAATAAAPLSAKPAAVAARPAPVKPETAESPASPAPAAPVAASPAPAKAIAPAAPAPPVPAVPAGWTPAHRGAYVWDARPFLNEATRVETLDRFSRSGFTRMLLSFTPAEIADVRTPEGRARLEGFLRDAERRGLPVDLLLGDPAWITEKSRGDLRDLLVLFRPFAFRSLHLDLEPDMLPGSAARRPQLLRELGETLKMAVAEAGRPVGISMHPRYFEGELAALTSDILGNLGLSEVALMIYSTNDRSVALRFQAICTSFPGMSFSLAQSVEKSLPEGESYFTGGASAFATRMRQLAGEVEAGNARDLIVQSWRDYLEMKR